MQYAIVGNARREATPGGLGRCPLCSDIVRARCGAINAWHWAHPPAADCDSWSEGESAWHLAWKRRFPKQWREVVIGRHRADIHSPQAVIELQASSIPSSELAVREEFYGTMVWLVDARRFRMAVRDKGGYVTFRWRHPHKTWWHANRQLYFDRGDHLLKIHNLYPTIPCGGSGTLVTYDAFIEAYSRPRRGEDLCAHCMMPFLKAELIETGMYEYCTMDIDPETPHCWQCYESFVEQSIPDDPALFDCLTPVRAPGRIGLSCGNVSFVN